MARALRSLGKAWLRVSFGERKTWLNTRSIIDSTENGGVISFYYNSGADTLADTLAALHRLGAHDVVVELEGVSHLFGTTVPPTVESRNDMIESWGDDPTIERVLESADSALMPKFANLEILLEEFVRKQGLAADV